MFNSQSFNFFVVFCFMAVGLLLASCTSPPVQEEVRLPPKDFSTGASHTVTPPAYLLEVTDPNSDKIYVFTNPSDYQEYRSTGELPSGKEVNLGQTSKVLVGVPEDSSVESSGVYQLYQGKVQPQDDFYVQRLVNDPTPRIYVFSSPDLLNTPLTELPIQQSSVDGPNGELVIYSLQGTDMYSLQKKFMTINYGN